MGVAAVGTCPTSDTAMSYMIPVHNLDAADCDQWRSAGCGETSPCDSQVRAAWLSQETWVYATDPRDDDDEVQMHRPLQLNWRRFNNVIPACWIMVDSCDVPMCCMLPFGTACVIKENGAARPQRRVLLALPKWAADRVRARWLARTNVKLPNIINVTRTIVAEEDDLTFIEFEYPSGESLDVWLQRQRMPESVARNLCFDLLNTLVGCRFSPIRFRGLLTPEAVYVSASGSLIGVMPVGSALSYSGVKHSLPQIEKVGNEGLPPELKRAFDAGNRMTVLSQEIASASDLYSAAAIVLQAMTGQQPEAARNSETTDVLSPLASDLLHKALYQDPSWRLSCEDALQHPWLKDCSSKASKR